MDLFESMLARAGINPDCRHGHNHGAPLSMWLTFGGMVTLATGVLGLAACLG